MRGRAAKAALAAVAAASVFVLVAVAGFRGSAVRRAPPGLRTPPPPSPAERLVLARIEQAKDELRRELIDGLAAGTDRLDALSKTVEELRVRQRQLELEADRNGKQFEESDETLRNKLEAVSAELREEEVIRQTADRSLRKLAEESRARTAASEKPLAVRGTHYESDFDVPGAPGDKRYDDSIPSAKLRYPNASADPRLRFTILCNMPRIYYFPEFMSVEECDELVNVSSRNMFRSGVVPYKGSNDDSVSEVRTSSQGHVSSRNPVSRAVTGRISNVTGFTVTELDQVLRYDAGQRYESHYDYFDPKFYGERSVNRAITFFMYLSTVDEGGETVFPRANGGAPTSDYKSCAKGLRVKARKGAAVMFYDMRPDGSLDEFSLHGGCKVTKGVKHAGTVWVPVRV